MSFAGQKDKHAVTEQWLCARVPGKEMPDLSKFQLEGCQVLEYARHKRKLRLGALKGNQFTVILREISDRQDVETRLQAIAERGVPNYFGAQRFGIGGSNLQGAMRWAESGAPVRDRNKRSFWLSAARSALFNQQVSIRLKTEFNQVVDGDALQLAGRGSWFVVTPEELEVSQARVHNRELMITATLPGSGDWEASATPWLSSRPRSPRKPRCRRCWYGRKSRRRAGRCFSIHSSSAGTGGMT